MKITYDLLPPSAQKAYNMTSKIRTVTMFIGFASAIIMFILAFGEIFNGKDNLFTVLGGSFMFGGFLHGIVHMEFTYKKLARSLGIIGLFLCLFVAMIGAYIGFIFMIIDLVLFIKKKPLIYPYENVHFLYSKGAQEELAAMEIAAAVNTDNAESVKESLEKLKEMLDSGLISEIEYENKKAELLNRL